MLPIRLRPLIFSVLLAFLGEVLPASAANTMVRLDTPLGSMTLELYNDAKPVTVANFLRYIHAGRFTKSFAHRLPQGFVLQGGAFFYTDLTAALDIATYPAIVNEAGPFPTYSNVKGTIVMAKVAGDPNSATASWFINLKDNNTGTADEGNLDLQNSGFTVFGRVVSGLDVLEKFNAFTTYASADGTNLIVNVGSPFDTLPVLHVVNKMVTYLNDLIYTTWTIIGDPVPAITSTITETGVVGVPFSHQITATNNPTSYTIETGTLPAGLSLNASTGLISGTPTAGAKNVLTLNATNADGTGGGLLFISIPDPEPVPPGPASVTTKNKVVGRHGKVVLKGSASASTIKIEVKAVKGGFKPAKGSPAHWTFSAKGIKPGKYKFQVQATNASGQVALKFVSVLVTD